MTDKNTGGPAFPVTLQPGEMYKSHAEYDGMTLRDYFAARAVSGLISGAMADGSRFDPAALPAIAGASYMIADAMLEARKS